MLTTTIAILIIAFIWETLSESAEEKARRHAPAAAYVRRR